jgi:hypothetical protein
MRFQPVILAKDRLKGPMSVDRPENYQQNELKMACLLVKRCPKVLGKSMIAHDGRSTSAHNCFAAPCGYLRKNKRKMAMRRPLREEDFRGSRRLSR